jgi:hypothetical protein
VVEEVLEGGKGRGVVLALLKYRFKEDREGCK